MGLSRPFLRARLRGRGLKTQNRDFRDPNRDLRDFAKHGSLIFARGIDRSRSQPPTPREPRSGERGEGAGAGVELLCRPSADKVGSKPSAEP